MTVLLFVVLPAVVLSLPRPPFREQIWQLLAGVVAIVALIVLFADTTTRDRWILGGVTILACCTHLWTRFEGPRVPVTAASSGPPATESAPVAVAEVPPATAPSEPSETVAETVAEIMAASWEDVVPAPPAPEPELPPAPAAEPALAPAPAAAVAPRPAAAPAPRKRALRPSKRAAAKSTALADEFRTLAQEVAGPIGPEIQVIVDPNVPALPPEVLDAVHRVVEETVANVVDHTDAQHVSIGLRREDALLRIRVKDDGTATGPWEPGLGMAILHEQAEQTGGRAKAGHNGTHGVVDVWLGLAGSAHGRQ